MAPRLLLPVAAALALAACETGPVPVSQAEYECAERAREAARPTGTATIGANSREGLIGGISIGVTTDFLAGRDPEEVYTSCVVNKSGQAPTRPLSLVYRS